MHDHSLTAEKGSFNKLEQGGGGTTPNIFLKTMEIRANGVLGKINRIRANISQITLNFGHFISIVDKNSGKLSSGPPEGIRPVRLCSLNTCLFTFVRSTL